MSNKKISKYGKNTRFSSANQPANNGRKKSQISLLCEEMELKYDMEISKHDAKKLFELLALAPESELKELIKNPELPAIIKSYARAMISDIKASRINAAKDIVEFSFGKANKKVSIETVEPETAIELDPEKLLSTAEYIVSSCLDLTALENLKLKLDEVIVRKRSDNALIING